MVTVAGARGDVTSAAADVSASNSCCRLRACVDLFFELCVTSWCSCRYHGGTLALALTAGTAAAGGDVIGDVVVGDSGDDVTELCGDA